MYKLSVKESLDRKLKKLRKKRQRIAAVDRQESERNTEGPLPL